MLDSFLQCWVHILLGLDGGLWKINLRILWNHIMKNFQVKHGQCDSIIFSRNIFFWRLLVIARPLPCWQQDFLLLICPRIYPQIYHRTPRPAVLICKGIISQCGHPSCALQKRPSSSFQFGQEENIPGHSTERRAYWFILEVTRMFPILTNRNRMMNTFIIDNITATCER